MRMHMRMQDLLNCGARRRSHHRPARLTPPQATVIWLGLLNQCNCSSKRRSNNNNINTVLTLAGTILSIGRLLRHVRRVESACVCNRPEFLLFFFCLVRRTPAGGRVRMRACMFACACMCLCARVCMCMRGCRKSLSRERTFRATNDVSFLLGMLASLARTLAHDAEEEGLAAKTGKRTTAEQTRFFFSSVCCPRRCDMSFRLLFSSLCSTHINAYMATHIVHKHQ